MSGAARRKTKLEPALIRPRRFVAAAATPVVAGSAPTPLARLVITGSAASGKPRDVSAARGMLLAAFGALRTSHRKARILVTPAGFVQYQIGGEWSGTSGWQTTQSDFDRLATVAAGVANEIVTPEVQEAAKGAVDHVILGVDVWPSQHRKAYGEVACLYSFANGKCVPVTGKSYPNTGQQNHLIRNPDVDHVVQIDEDRVAVLVCHDLAAWNPRGNAVAKGVRATAWRAMQDAVGDAQPTLAVHLAHTVSTADTWRNAWSRFADRAGAAFHSGTTAIRHLDLRWHEVSAPPDSRLLAGTGRGERAIDVMVTEVPT